MTSTLASTSTTDRLTPPLPPTFTLSLPGVEREAQARAEARVETETETDHAAGQSTEPSDETQQRVSEQEPATRRKRAAPWDRPKGTVFPDEATKGAFHRLMQSVTDRYDATQVYALVLERFPTVRKTFHSISSDLCWYRAEAEKMRARGTPIDAPDLAPEDAARLLPVKGDRFSLDRLYQQTTPATVDAFLAVVAAERPHLDRTLAANWYRYFMRQHTLPKAGENVAALQGPPSKKLGRMPLIPAHLQAARTNERASSSSTATLSTGSTDSAAVKRQRLVPDESTSATGRRAPGRPRLPLPPGFMLALHESESSITEPGTTATAKDEDKRHVEQVPGDRKFRPGYEDTQTRQELFKFLESVADHGDNVMVYALMLEKFPQVQRSLQTVGKDVAYYRARNQKLREQCGNPAIPDLPPEYRDAMIPTKVDRLVLDGIYRQCMPANLDAFLAEVATKHPELDLREAANWYRYFMKQFLIAPDLIALDLIGPKIIEPKKQAAATPDSAAVAPTPTPTPTPKRTPTPAPQPTPPLRSPTRSTTTDAMQTPTIDLTEDAPDSPLSEASPPILMIYAGDSDSDFEQDDVVRVSGGELLHDHDMHGHFTVGTIPVASLGDADATTSASQADRSFMRALFERRS